VALTRSLKLDRLWQRLLNGPGADFGQRQEPAMADKKSDFVDLISDATRQYWRRPARRAAIEAAPKEEKRLSNWPPVHLQQWRLEKLTPWKMKLHHWKFKDWT
jgi:hypothetical protein